MVQAGFGKVVFVAICRYVFVHECHRGRLVVECAQVHDLDALALVDGQVFGGAAIQFFLPGSFRHSPVEVRLGHEIRQADDTDPVKSGFVRIIDTLHPILPPEPLQRRHHEIKVPLNAVIAHFAHFNGVGNRVQHPNSRFVGTALLVGVAHAPNGDVICGRDSHDLGSILGQIKFLVLFFEIKGYIASSLYFFPQPCIPYLQIRVDGICQVTPTHFTKTIQFRDINYQLSDNEDKQAIFDGWCDFLNYFDSSIKFQFSFVNLTALRESFVRAIPLRSDQFESIQRELSKIIEEQQAKGNNGIVKTKYLTFGIDADNIRSAKPRLERIETDILNNFKRLGVSAEVLNGQERLRVLHDILRMDTPEPFTFRWEDLPRSGLSTKDYIAPSSFLFNRAKDFRMGRKFASVSFLQILAPELSDRILKDFLDIESNIVVNIHVQSVDQISAIKTIKRTITDLDKSKIEEQKKAVRAGYDMDIIPSDLATYGAEAKKLLSDLQSRNQRMFLVGASKHRVCEYAGGY